MSADAQPDVLDVRFPTRRILAIVGDKWTTVVLYCVSIREHRRFSELQKQIHGYFQEDVDPDSA